MKVTTSLATTFSAVLLLTACSSTIEPTTRPPKGNANAPIVVKEYADLQCPACRAAHTEITKPLLAKYGNRIRFEFMHFPLSTIHPYALVAAIASECAADQGKFWEFIDLTYEKQSDLSVEALGTWGEELGLDMDEYSKCRKSRGKRKLVLSEYKAGRGLGVQGTPTFFVNDEQVPTDKLSEAIDEAYKAVMQRL